MYAIFQTYIITRYPIFKVNSMPPYKKWTELNWKTSGIRQRQNEYKGLTKHKMLFETWKYGRQDLRYSYIKSIHVNFMYIQIYEQKEKQGKNLQNAVMSNLYTNCLLKVGFRKVD